MIDPDELSEIVHTFMSAFKFGAALFIAAALITGCLAIVQPPF